MELLSTKEAAERLGVTTARIRQLVQSGRLKGQKVGRDLVFTAEEIENFKPQKAGRPKQFPNPD